MEKQITKSQFITWLITIALFVISMIATSYININSRIKALELNVHALEIKYNQHDKTIQEVRDNIKDIKSLLYEIDKKVSINEEKLKR